MSNSDGQRSLQDVLQSAQVAESQGVPVDWKSMAMQIYNVAMNHIAQLEQEPPPASGDMTPED